MNVRLSDNIRRLRRENNWTQEKLAEFLGVSVGAVYKWERGHSVPELPLLLQMASLFSVSTDVLLGYELNAPNLDEILEKLKERSRKEEFEVALSEAEEGLLRFPNQFPLVYQAATLYYEKAKRAHEEKEIDRGLQLHEHACRLLSQNTDETIHEVFLRKRMAELRLWNGEPDIALKLLKKYNVCGVNDAAIGMILADFLHDTKGAEHYLGRSFRESMENMEQILIGYINLLFWEEKNYDGIFQCIELLRAMSGTRGRGEVTAFDKFDCLLSEVCAEIHCFSGNSEEAKSCLKEALRTAERFDRTPPEDIRPIPIYETLGIPNAPTYEAFGSSAMEALLSRKNRDVSGLAEIWEIAQKEVSENESV